MELKLLNEFMEFQSVFRLDQIEISRDLYFQIEARIVNFFKWTIITVGVILIAMFLLTNVFMQPQIGDFVDLSSAGI